MCDFVYTILVCGLIAGRPLQSSRPFTTPSLNHFNPTAQQEIPDYTIYQYYIQEITHNLIFNLKDF
jgi:hypothetical protein